jgi:deazaflavin-dependent oxidoreductase (nitroreductase family)
MLWQGGSMATAAGDSQRPRWHLWRDRFWSTPFGTWIILNVTTHIDPLLLRLSGGRFTSGSMIGFPTLLLTTTGARSGKPRSRAVLYFVDGDNLVLIASRGGMARHPGWYHNLKAHPEVQVLLGSRSGAYLAREATADERARLWARARDVYRGFDAYEQRAGARQIPVVVLTFLAATFGRGSTKVNTA